MKKVADLIKYTTKVLNQSGVALIDYAVILALIVVLSFLVIGSIETNSSNVFENTTDTVKDFGLIPKP